MILKNTKTSEDGVVRFFRKCLITGVIYSVTLTADQVTRFRDPNLAIQNALPELSADQREFLLSGLTPAEWDSLF